MSFAWIAFEMWWDLVRYGRLADKPEFMEAFYAALNGRDRATHFWYGASGREKVII